MPDKPDARGVLAALRAERPRFHASSAVEQGDAGQWDWSIQPPILDYLAGLATPCGATLETGCGYSTVLLAAQSARHYVVTPIAAEVALIRRWGAAHGLPMDHVVHLDGPSQDVLPAAELPELDLVLIDGDHAFPAPFIDWYYTADRLRPGGTLMVDDIQLRACKLLDGFLRTETDRWTPTGRLGNTSLWRRRNERPVARGVTHGEQPFAGEIVTPAWIAGQVRGMVRRVVRGR